jgi:hypothetical protein
MKEEDKWKSIMKSSGSARRHVQRGSYSASRNIKIDDPENLPYYESFKQTRKVYNGKLNTNCLKNLLIKRVGGDWDDIYSEVIKKIPRNIMRQENLLSWFVADKVEYVEGKVFNKKSSKFLWTKTYDESNCDNIEFYVCPNTNKLFKAR